MEGEKCGKEELREQEEWEGVRKKGEGIVYKKTRKKSQERRKIGRKNKRLKRNGVKGKGERKKRREGGRWEAIQKGKRRMEDKVKVKQGSGERNANGRQK